jgi:cytochrome c
MDRPRLALMGTMIAAGMVPQLVWADEGGDLFVKNCQTCHTIDKGGGVRQGPPLWGVVGRKAGSVPGFQYSDGLKASGIVWTPEKIDEWITFPKKLVRGTFMSYRQSDPAIRKAIVAYVAAHRG